MPNPFQLTFIKTLVCTICTRLHMYTVKVCTECGEEYCSGTCAVFQYESFQVKVQEAKELVKPPTPARGWGGLFFQIDLTASRTR